jgi:hypothetical protein
MTPYPVSKKEGRRRRCFINSEIVFAYNPQKIIDFSF